MTTIDDTYTGRASPPPARTASRPTVSYHDYVHAFARMAAWYAILAAGGVSAIMGAIINNFHGAILVLAIAGGLGLLIGGGVGLLATLAAHAAYTKHLATTTTTTYQEPPKVETVRPFVASRNAPRTIRAGRISLPATTWERLFETAASNGGRLTRDGAIKAGLPRDLYHASWQSTIGEFRRLGIVDEEGKLTDAANRMLSPHPEEATAQPFAHRTNERRTNGANGEG